MPDLDTWHSAQRRWMKGEWEQSSGSLGSTARTLTASGTGWFGVGAGAAGALPEGTPSKKKPSHFRSLADLQPATANKPQNPAATAHRNHLRFLGCAVATFTPEIGTSVCSDPLFFVAEPKDTDLARAVLAGDEDEVFQLEIRRGILLEQADVVVIHRHLGRKFQADSAGARVAEPHQQLPLAVKDLDYLGGRVHRIKPVFPVHGDAFGAAEFAGIVAVLAHSANIFAVGVVNLDAITTHVAGVHAALGIHCQVGRLK